jgi:hypothetical protein
MRLQIWVKYLSPNIRQPSTAMSLRFWRLAARFLSQRISGLPEEAGETEPELQHPAGLPRAAVPADV